MTPRSGRGASAQHSPPWRLIGWGAAAALLLLPLIAMQFTEAVAWTISDFVFAGLLLGGVGVAFALVVRRPRTASFRIAAAVALTTAFLLTWINAAVGVIGAEGRAATGLYVVVLATALTGAAMTRLRPRPLAVAMAVTAAVQVLVPLAAAVAWPQARPQIAEPEVLGLTVVFAGLWLLSAWLFRRSAPG